MATMTTKPHWVFAYGSNMELGDLEHWFTRSNEPWGRLLEVSRAQLPDFRLVWNFYSETRRGGAANVEPCQGHTLHGLALLVDDVVFAGIDKKEGYPHVYDRAQSLVELASGTSVEAWVYRVNPERTLSEFVAPTRHYRGLLIQGARAHGLPAFYIEELERLTTRD
jgi:gamma-glutamylcyclotransferase (GGCT)/AIG2-like uncharacterized protein YtfP